MLHAADEFRLKRHALEKQLGKQLVVTWSEEDSYLSMTKWDNDLRTCVVHKYVASTQEFVLRFKCGYETIVDGNAVVQLVDQSESFHASTKAKTKRSVVKANLEWGTLVDNAGPTHVVMPVDSSSKVQEVEDSIRLALAQREEQRRQAEEQALAQRLKTQEDHERLVTKYAETMQQQRANILRLEEEHAAAAQKQAAAALLQKQHDEAAEQLEAQKVADAKLHEEKKAASALLQNQQHTTKGDVEDASMEGEEQAGWGRGSYRRQDINKSIDYLRSYGMGKGWSNRRDLPDVLPTFYVDDENGTDARYPPPPPTEPPQEKQEQVSKQEDPSAAKKRKRRVTRKRVPVKVEKHVDEEDNDEVDPDVEFVHLSSNTARRILWQRGHAAQLPSAKADIIRRATVANISDAYDPLCQLGFAIIEDMTEVYAPKNRCTREQRDFINKCECTILHRICMRTLLHNLHSRTSCTHRRSRRGS